MLDLSLRPLKERCLQPLAAGIPPFITANHLTFAAFICGLAAVVSAALPLSATPDSSTTALTTSYQPLIFWLFNRLLDSIDGTLARLRGADSPLGGFLDLLGDFVVYALVPIGIGLGNERFSATSVTSGLGGSLTSSSTPLAVNWKAIAVLEATFFINNFVLFYISGVAAEMSSPQRSVQSGTEGGDRIAKQKDRLTSVIMTPALVEGLESGVLFTCMFVFPRWLNTWCWVMSVGVAAGTVQRVKWAVEALSINEAEVKSSRQQGRDKSSKAA